MHLIAGFTESQLNPLDRTHWTDFFSLVQIITLCMRCRDIYSLNLYPLPAGITFLVGKQVAPRGRTRAQQHRCVWGNSVPDLMATTLSWAVSGSTVAPLGRVFLSFPTS